MCGDLLEDGKLVLTVSKITSENLIGGITMA